MSQSMLKIRADVGRSIFEAVMTMIRKSLSMENNSSAYMCNPEADSDLVETLDRLVVAQSKEQWLRFSRQPGAKSYSRPSSQADGRDL